MSAAEEFGVVGAGIVGLAVARAISLATGAAVTVFEKEHEVAVHQTGRNSGVVHAGLYYAPGSLKARLCRRGVTLLREYCGERGVAYEALGKVVVATEPEELSRFEAVAERAIANGVPGLRRLGPSALRDLEPHVVGLAALHSPETAVVDYAAVARALAQDVRAAGGEVRLGEEVVGVDRTGSGRLLVRTSTGAHELDRLVVCAGLWSDQVARMVGGPPGPAIVPFRGEYFDLAPERRHLVRGLVYPVPDPRYPFLGVHFTRGVHGGVHVGPNAVMALARDGYRWRDLDFGDTAAMLRWPGMRPLARRHWRMGVKEMTGSVLKPLTWRRARRFIPELRLGDLRPAPAGVRAQALRENGELVDDFAIDELEGITIVRNAPSPAATSSLAIAEHLLPVVLKRSGA